MAYEAKFDPKQVRERYKQGVAVFKEQRKRELNALKFMVPDNQWTEQAKAQRNGGPGINGQAVPARPCLSVDKIGQPVQLVQNQFQNANMGINVHPLSEKANKETAEIIQGLIRKYERDSNAVLPRGWAFDRAVEAGTGAYRIVTEYDEDTEDPFDQKILCKRILRQDMVILDPSAQEPDYSDGEWAFIASYMPIDKFKREFPDADLAGAEETELAEISVDQPEWIQQDGDTWGVLVAEYFCKHYEAEEIAIPLKDGGVAKRTKQNVKLMWSKVAAGSKDEIQELESQEWNGQYIPIIPVVGKEMQPYDKERRYSGIVENAMDSQRGFNYAITNSLEIAALEPRAPFIGVEGQFEGHEEKWNQANVRNWPYLEYKPAGLSDGSPAPPPQRMQIDSNRLSVSMQLSQMFDQALQATTFTPDPALGKHSRDESGKAIMALQNQSQASQSNYMSNMAQISMTYEAKVLLDMIPRIYDRPGRIARIIDFEDETQEVMLNQPFVVDPATGRPTPAQPPVDGMSTTQGPTPKPKEYNLTEGKYGVSVSIGKSYASRMEQGKETLLSLFEISPETVPILLPTFMKFSDEPWAQEAAKLMKSVRDQKFPGLDKPEPGEETPEQLRAQLEAQQAKLQQAEQIMQQMKQALDTKQVEQQGKIEAERVKAESDVMKSQNEGQVKAMIEEVQAENEQRLAVFKEEAAKERQTQAEAFQMALEEMKQEFQAMQAALDRRAAEESQRIVAEQMEENKEGEDE